jgi:outer membrane protein assembly factor BamB
MTRNLFSLLLALIIISGSTASIAFAQVGGRNARDRRRRENQQKQQQQEKANRLENQPAVFAMQWQFASEKTSRLPALAEDDAVYLPLADGRVVSLEAGNGDFRWETAPGGTLVSPLASTSEAIFIASRHGEKGQEGGLLRAINKRSGLAIWTKESPQPICAPIVIDQEKIYTAGEDQNLYALNSGNGEMLWSASLGAPAHGRPLVVDDDIFIGTETGLMYALARVDGRSRWQFQASGPLRGSASVNADNIYFGDSDGYVYCLDRDSGKLRWRVRTGAAVESAPTLLNRLVMVASFDNFIYGLNVKSGDRVWKLRMQSRISFDPIINGDNLIVTPLGGAQLFTLSIAGRVSGQFSVESGEIIAPPTLQNSWLFIVTSDGLMAARAQAVVNPPDDKKKKTDKEPATPGK